MVGPGRVGSPLALLCYRFLPATLKEIIPKDQELWGELGHNFQFIKKMIAQVPMLSFQED